MAKGRIYTKLGNFLFGILNLQKKVGVLVRVSPCSGSRCVCDRRPYSACPHCWRRIDLRKKRPEQNPVPALIGLEALVWEVELCYVTDLACIPFKNESFYPRALLSNNCLQHGITTHSSVKLAPVFSKLVFLQIL